MLCETILLQHRHIFNQNVRSLYHSVLQCFRNDHRVQLILIKIVIDTKILWRYSEAQCNSYSYTLTYGYDIASGIRLSRIGYHDWLQYRVSAWILDVHFYANTLNYWKIDLVSNQNSWWQFEKNFKNLLKFKKS